MNPAFHVGDLMIIDDHINFFPEHPLQGKNFPTGPRFPDMHEAYDKGLRDLADGIAKEKRRAIVGLLKAFRVEISGKRPVAEAIITSGGVKVS